MISSHANCKFKFGDSNIKIQGKTAALQRFWPKKGHQKPLGSPIVAAIVFHKPLRALFCGKLHAELRVVEGD
jgi:hypothetical protein